MRYTSANSSDFIEAMERDAELEEIKQKLFIAIAKYRYTYNFSWFGRPIIQMPQDILAMQELIWEVQPDLIIECGVAHGGSLVLYASILEILGGDREVLGIDIEVREHNRRALIKHPLFHRIRLLVGSSLDSEIVRHVGEVARKKKKVMVVLDSNHTHTHVLNELQLYSPLVTKGSYLVVFDTLIEHMPEDTYSDRPWGKGNNPKTAVLEFLKSNERFEVDKAFENKLMLTTAPSGYLKCIKD